MNGNVGRAAQPGQNYAEDAAVSAGALPQKPAAPAARPRRARRAGLSLAAVALLLALLAAYAPAVLGRWILHRLTEDVQAASITGPIWAPVLHETRVQLPGITAQAERLGVRVSGFDWGRRVLYADLDIQQAEVALTLAELLRQGENVVTTEEGWRVELRSVTVADTALRVDGKAANIPDGTFQVSQARDGGLLAEGQTRDGALTAHVTLQPGPEGTQYLTTFWADARILRFYWPGVEAGTVTGRYLLGAGPVQGQLSLSGGRVTVPEADWITVDRISGGAVQQGDLFTVNLAGAGLKGGVKLQLNADLAAGTWQSELNARPSVAAAAQALGTSGVGTARLQVTAGSAAPGWQGVEVHALAAGRKLTLSGVPFDRLNVAYRYRDHWDYSTENGGAEINRLSVDGGLEWLGQQRLTGLWNLDGGGRLRWKGDLLGAPLDVQAGLTPPAQSGDLLGTRLQLRGAALGGDVRGGLTLGGEDIRLNLDPDVAGVRGAAGVTGSAGDLTVSAPALDIAGFTGRLRAHLGSGGLRADFTQNSASPAANGAAGRVQVRLGPGGERGAWTAAGLQAGGGVTLGGAGALDLAQSELRGELRLEHALLERPLAGPLRLDWAAQKADWQASAGGVKVGGLRWQGERLQADLQGLPLQHDITLRGTLQSDLGLQDLRGQVTVASSAFQVTALPEGRRVRWKGLLTGFPLALSGVTDLAEGFDTRLNLGGTGLRGRVQLLQTAAASPRLQFDLQTAAERASGSLSAERWDAAGRLDLGALQPVLNAVLGPDSPLADLRGTLDLNFAGTGGTARIKAQAAGFRVAGLLRRRGDQLEAAGLNIAAETGPLAGLRAAQVSGLIYPRADLRGPVTLPALGGLEALAGQTLQAHISGEYSALTASLQGRMGPLSVRGVAFPAQELALKGRLTPELQFTGRWGRLNLAYSGASGLLQVSGVQEVTAAGRRITVRGSASRGERWQGRADLQAASLDGYTLQLQGPWSALQAELTHRDGLRVSGRVSLPAAAYDVTVSGRAQGLGFSGRVRRRGLQPRGRLVLTDALGGRAFLDLDGLNHLTLQARALQLAGTTWSGDLRSVDGLADGLLTGEVAGERVTLQAVRGILSAGGTWAGHRVEARGCLHLPAPGQALTLDDLRLRVDGPYVRAQASGRLDDLRGTVTLRAQEWGGPDAALILPAQTLPLQASLNPLQVQVGGLTYRPAGGLWRGSAGLSYLVRARGAAGLRGGELRLQGEGGGGALRGLLSGSLSGRVTLQPTLAGTVSADTALLRAFLPQDWQQLPLSGGRLQATFDAGGAGLQTSGVRWAGGPLNLFARLDWRQGASPNTISAAGTLTTARSKLPFSLRSGALAVRGGTLNLADLPPALQLPLQNTPAQNTPAQNNPVQGTLRGNIWLPNIAAPNVMDTLQADLQADLRLPAPQAALRGRLQARRGQWAGQLQARLPLPAGDLPLSIRGDLYPRTSAVLQAGDLTARLSGDLRQTLQWSAAGEYSGQAVNVRGAARGLLGAEAASVTLGGTLGGAKVNLTVQQAGQRWQDWAVAGRALLPDASRLHPSLAGHLRAEAGGTLGRARLQVAGELNGAALNVPATFEGGRLLLQRAQASFKGLGTAVLSGSAYPCLNLSGPATLEGDLAGRYTLQVTGTPQAPEAALRGHLAGAAGSLHPSGLNLGGTALTATYGAGGAWQARLDGAALSGTLRGRLPSAPGGPPLGLQAAALSLHARYQQGGNVLNFSGPLAWNAGAGPSAGWRGQVTGGGELQGQPLSFQAAGRGVLALQARLGEGALQAELGPQALQAPQGWAELQGLDLGALLGAGAGQLQQAPRLTVRADLGGADWGHLQAALGGRLEDPAGELSGQLSGHWAAAGGGAGFLRLQGRALQGGATLAGGRWTAQAQAEPPLHLERLLPAAWQVTELQAAGYLSAGGTLQGGLQRLSAQGLQLSGRHAEAGPFSLGGSASYQPGDDGLEVALAGNYGGGVVWARGQLPQGVQVQAANVSLAAFASQGFDPGRLNGAAVLTGPLRAARLQGTFWTAGGDADMRLTASGPLADPQVTGQAVLHGLQQAGGTLDFTAHHFDPARRTFQVAVRGTLTQGEARLGLNVAGAWPLLGGEVNLSHPALAEPLTLRGQGGTFTLHSADPASQAAQGRVALQEGAGGLPVLQASADLDPSLIAGLEASGGRLHLEAAGELTALQVSGGLQAEQLSAAGATFADLGATFSGAAADGLEGLRGTLTQGGAEVGTLAGGVLQLTGLQAGAAGAALALSGQVDTAGAADLTAEASGALEGRLHLQGTRQGAELSGSLQGYGYRLGAELRGSETAGWSGAVNLRGTDGQTEVLTAPAHLTVSGPWNNIQLQGPLGLLGAGAALSASRSGAALTLKSSGSVQASGTIRLTPDAAGTWRWNGAASLSGPRFDLTAAPSGELTQPAVQVKAARGSWQAEGTLSPAQGRLSLSDGQTPGRLSWQGNTLDADLPGLDLAGLHWREVTGRLTAQGRLHLGAGSRAEKGEGLPFRLDDLNTPWRVDALGLPLAGQAQGVLTLPEGRPALDAQLQLSRPNSAAESAADEAAEASAHLHLTAAQQEGGEWFGQLGGEVRRGAPASGSLQVQVQSSAAGLTGTLSADEYPVTLQGLIPNSSAGRPEQQAQTLALSGQAELGGQTFGADFHLDGPAGHAALTGSGSLGRALPFLTSVTALKDTGDYALSARLSGVDVGRLALVPDLHGTVSGEADITDGAGQWVLRSSDLNLAGEAFPARIEGLLVGDDWRIRGYLGDTDLFAGVSDGVLSGGANLRALPLGAVANALAGYHLADGRVTGVARFNLPLADPLSGRATVVAERIRLTTLPDTLLDTPPDAEEAASPSETLTGTGFLDFADRELRSVNVQLSGAGTWDIQGQYTRQKVDLQAKFTETTFTPLLSLVPALAGGQPRLQGSLNMNLSGAYGQPTGSLSAQNLRGSYSGVSVRVPELSAALAPAGQWNLQGRLLTGGALVSSGKLQGSGLWQEEALRGAAIRYSGEAAPSGLGTLPAIEATLSQNQNGPERWSLEARSVTQNSVTGTGTLQVSGELLPAWNLSVQARNYDLPVQAVYLRESSLNAGLTLREEIAGGPIRVRGAADFARAILGRPDAASNLASLVPSPESPAAALGSTEQFISPLPEPYASMSPLASSAAATKAAQPENAQEGAKAASAAPPPLLSRLVFEQIPLRFSGGLRLQESLAQAEASGSLTVSGTGARPLIAGRLSGQRGTLLLRDNEFNIRRLVADFPGTSAYPSFTLQAEGRVRPLTGGVAVPITLSAQGNFLDDGSSTPVLDFRTALQCSDSSAACTDPATGAPYTESQLYALVLTGLPDVDRLPENMGTLGASALNTALNVFVLGELSRNLAEALGVDVLRFTPALVGEGGATFTIGSRLTENLYLEYQVDLRGAGLVDATYNTPDGRFTFKVTTPFDLSNSASAAALSPSVSAAYNINSRTAVSFNITSTAESQRFGVGIRYRFPGLTWNGGRK